jgi:hypothetical protein
MVNKLAIDKFYWAVYLKYPLTMHFHGIVPKLHTVNKSTALNHGKCINTCEPAAVLVFLQRIKVVELRVPESAAAGHFEVKCKNKAKQKKEDKK